ncbi:MAG: DUF6128 domain-containing protein [Lachnospiraceae bacterium]
MRQFIRYLYEYERGTRVRNIGFVKVEQEEQRCVVHLHGKGLRLGEEKQLVLYLFYTKDGKCIGIPQGIIDNVNPALNYRLEFTAEDVDGFTTMNQIEGIILIHADDGRYAAVWTDMPVDVEHMELASVETDRDKMSTEEVQTEEVQTEEGTCESTMVDDQEEVKTEGITVETVEATTEREEYIEPQGTQYIKIQRQELSKLDRKEWKLANNSFLLHGYYNYHHLLLVKEGPHYFIGVPGIYHEKERAAAQAFGFTQFQRLTEDELKLTDEEQNLYEDFGYWCRQVEGYHV